MLLEKGALKARDVLAMTYRLIKIILQNPGMCGQHSITFQHPVQNVTRRDVLGCPFWADIICEI